MLNHLIYLNYMPTPLSAELSVRTVIGAETHLVSVRRDVIGDTNYPSFVFRLSHSHPMTVTMTMKHEPQYIPLPLYYS